jgi:hypothetical protein
LRLNSARRQGFQVNNWRGADMARLYYSPKGQKKGWIR